MNLELTFSLLMVECFTMWVGAVERAEVTEVVTSDLGSSDTPELADRSMNGIRLPFFGDDTRASRRDDVTRGLSWLPREVTRQRRRRTNQRKDPGITLHDTLATNPAKKPSLKSIPSHHKIPGYDVSTSTFNKTNRHTEMDQSKSNTIGTNFHELNFDKMNNRHHLKTLFREYVNGGTLYHKPTITSNESLFTQANSFQVNITDTLPKYEQLDIVKLMHHYRKQEFEKPDWSSSAKSEPIKISTCLESHKLEAKNILSDCEKQNFNSWKPSLSEGEQQSETVNTRPTVGEQQFETVNRSLSEGDQQFETVNPRPSEDEQQFPTVNRSPSENEQQFETVNTSPSEDNQQIETANKNPVESEQQFVTVKPKPIEDNQQFEIVKPKPTEDNQQFETVKLKTSEDNQQFETVKLKPSEDNQQFETVKLKPSEDSQQFQTVKLKPSEDNQQYETLKSKPSEDNQQFEKVKPSLPYDKQKLETEQVGIYDKPHAFYTKIDDLLEEKLQTEENNKFNDKYGTQLKQTLSNFDNQRNRTTVATHGNEKHSVDQELLRTKPSYNAASNQEVVMKLLTKLNKYISDANTGSSKGSPGYDNQQLQVVNIHPFEIPEQSESTNVNPDSEENMLVQGASLNDDKHNLLEDEKSPRPDKQLLPLNNTSHNYTNQSLQSIKINPINYDEGSDFLNGDPFSDTLDLETEQTNPTPNNQKPNTLNINTYLDNHQSETDTLSQLSDDQSSEVTDSSGQSDWLTSESERTNPFYHNRSSESNEASLQSDWLKLKLLEIMKISQNCIMQPIKTKTLKTHHTTFHRTEQESTPVASELRSYLKTQALQLGRDTVATDLAKLTLDKAYIDQDSLKLKLDELELDIDRENLKLDLLKLKIR